MFRLENLSPFPLTLLSLLASFTLCKAPLKMILIIHQSWKSANPVYIGFVKVSQDNWEEMLFVCVYVCACVRGFPWSE